MIRGIEHEASRHLDVSAISQLIKNFKKADKATVSSVMGLYRCGHDRCSDGHGSLCEQANWGLVAGVRALNRCSVFLFVGSKARTVYAVDLYNASLPKNVARQA